MDVVNSKTGIFFIRPFVRIYGREIVAEEKKKTVEDPIPQDIQQPYELFRYTGSEDPLE